MSQPRKAILCTGYCDKAFVHCRNFARRLSLPEQSSKSLERGALTPTVLSSRRTNLSRPPSGNRSMMENFCEAAVDGDSGKPLPQCVGSSPQESMTLEQDTPHPAEVLSLPAAPLSCVKQRFFASRKGFNFDAVFFGKIFTSFRFGDAFSLFWFAFLRTLLELVASSPALFS